MKRFASNRILAFLLVLWLALITSASSSPDAESAASGSDGGGYTAARQNAASQGIVVVDSLENKVYLPTQVKAVASMRSGITEVICALGQKDKIIAVDEMVKAGTAYGMFITDVHPDLMNRVCPLVGHGINVEEILRLKPDVVLHGGFGRIDQVKVLKKQVPQLAVVIAHFETLEDYLNDIRIVARCVQAESRADTLIAYLKAKIDFVSSRVRDIPQGSKIRVFYGGHDVYHAFGGKTFEHSEIMAAGGLNVAGELLGWMPEVSPEQLLAWDPQVILLLNGVSVEEVLKDSRLSSLSAVKSRRVYALPESGWDFSSPRALFCIEWLASTLYPERFSDIDIQVEVNDFYQKVFGVNYRGPALKEGRFNLSGKKGLVK